MILFKQFINLNDTLQGLKNEGKTVGFVPTMGALHQGHLSLIAASKKHNDITVCSIFVNPAQFNNSSDLENYPVTISSDISLLEEAGCDILFLPSESEIYPINSYKQKHFPLGQLETILEGQYRPGHFQGVCLVIDRLLSNIRADDLFMGRKDFQQCMVVKQLLQTEKLPVKLHTSPTLRHEDGLAMSSRNLRLNSQQRRIAPAIYKVLQNIKDNISLQNFKILKAQAKQKLEAMGFKTDYLELAKTANLEITDEYKNGEEYVLLIAAYLGDIRLIDNVLIP